MEKQIYEEAYQRIKDEVMDQFGYDEVDLDVEEIEDEVNRETDARFTEEFGFDYLDILGESDDEPIGVDEEGWEEEDIDWLLDDDNNSDEYDENF